jgi:uncharacterized protein YegL
MYKLIVDNILHRKTRENEMKDGLTEIIAILDNSGSMANLTNDTIGGYNTFINDQKNIPGEAILTTVFFNTNYQIFHDRMDIKKVKPITEKEYHAGGSTALLDAMGKTINNVGLQLHNMAEDERPSKVIVFIITDGEENASKEFTNEKIKEMVELQKNSYNWEFLFMGANIDSFSVAETIGINKNRAFNYSAQHIGNAQQAMNIAVGNYRKHGNVDKGEDFRKEIE